MEQYLYMLISLDELELPLAVADSASGLARMLNRSPHTILSAMSHAKKSGKRSQYVKVRYLEDEEEGM